jgi:ATP-dependent DNA helicase RecG
VALTLKDLENLLSDVEAEHLEFKEAKNRFDFDKLVEYCAAIANEGGGKVVLGVTDRRPRTVVGTSAFSEPGATIARLEERLQIRVGFAELKPANGRVLIFEVPGRPVGVPIQAGAKFLVRSGDALRPMSSEELRSIFEEVAPDFSSQVEFRATLADLDREAIETFRRRWRARANNPQIDTLSAERLLADAELLTNEGVTVAALILLGAEQALNRFLPQSEVVFEYRSGDASIPHQQRFEYRKGFLGFLDQLWSTINLRNEVVTYQDGLFRREIPVMNEAVVREAVLNAVTHRDYRLPGSVFLKQYPRKLVITSPGGFPPGITVQNILHRQSPRNRRISEACARCGLVERSGQGADRMFEESLREGKAKPDYSAADDHQVTVVLNGEVRNPDFVRFLEKAGMERQASFSVDDLIMLDALQHDTGIAPELRPNLARLVEGGIVERVGRGRGVKHVLSRKFYSFLGRTGAYTRQRGLDRQTNKELLLKHIRESGHRGARLQDLQQVLPGLSRPQVQTLMRELKDEGRIAVQGLTRAARWYLVRPD